MDQTDQTVELALNVEAGPDSDAEEVAELTDRLRRELLDLDVESVEAPKGEPAPEGTKAVEVAVIGALIVKLIGSGGLPAVVDTIRNWLSGQRQRSVKLTIGDDTLEVSGVTSDQQKQLIETWIARQTAAGQS